jgi:hypothetical protein
LVSNELLTTNSIVSVQSIKADGRESSSPEIIESDFVGSVSWSCSGTTQVVEKAIEIQGLGREGIGEGTNCCF